MQIIKTFKFAANLEYVKTFLEQKKLNHFVDFEKLTLSCENEDKEKILKFIDDLKLDENEVEIDEDLLKGYEEWDKNMYNPYHYTGGKIPSFYQDKSNFLAYGFVFIVMGLVYLLGEIKSYNSSYTNIIIIVIITTLLSSSMFYQYYKFKKEKSKKQQ